MDAKHLKQLRASIRHEVRVVLVLSIAWVILYVIVLVVMFTIFSYANTILNHLYSFSQVRSDLLHVVFPVLSALMISAVLMLPITRRTTDAIINRRLANLHCPWCNCDLRGIDADHCPECGKPTAV
jgi:hypothetical protein